MRGYSGKLRSKTMIDNCPGSTYTYMSLGTNATLARQWSTVARLEKAAGCEERRDWLWTLMF